MCSPNSLEYGNCFKRALGCQGKALYDIEKQEFKVYNQCNFDINHETFKYEKYKIFLIIIKPII